VSLGESLMADVKRASSSSLCECWSLLGDLSEIVPVPLVNVVIVQVIGWGRFVCSFSLEGYSSKMKAGSVRISNQWSL